MATLHEHENNDYTTQVQCRLNTWLGQVITPIELHTVTSIKLHLRRGGIPESQPGTVTVSIAAASAGKPIGSDLTVGYTNGDTLGLTLSWREITFDPIIAVSSGLEYCIIVKCLEGDSNSYINWSRKDSGASYDGGIAVWSLDGGSSWTILAPAVHLFEVWGDAGCGGAIKTAYADTVLPKTIKQGMGHIPGSEWLHNRQLTNILEHTRR